jgi:hypothetical protein
MRAMSIRNTALSRHETTRKGGTLMPGVSSVKEQLLALAKLRELS